MKKFLLGAVAVLTVGIGLAVSQQFSMPPPAGVIVNGCVFNSSPQTIASGQAGFMQCDANGNVVTVASPTGVSGGISTVVGNVASGTTDSGAPVKVGCVYNTTLPTFTNGQRGDCQIGSRGAGAVTIFSQDSSVAANVATITADGAGSASGLTVNPRNLYFNNATWDRVRGDTNGAYVQGNVSSSGVDSGNPVKIGGRFNSTPPTLTDGQRGDAQLDSTAAIRSRLVGPLTAGADGVTNGTLSSVTRNDTQSSTLTPLTMAPFDFNGASWDRHFTCASSTPVGVTAGTGAQEIIGLTASQVIRVCGFVLTSSLTGTATFSYGTGTNCGTGNTPLTAAMGILTGANLPVSGASGSVFRTASANALCLTAVTGNLTGFVTFSKY